MLLLSHIFFLNKYIHGLRRYEKYQALFSCTPCGYHVLKQPLNSLFQNRRPGFTHSADRYRCCTVSPYISHTPNPLQKYIIYGKGFLSNACISWLFILTAPRPLLFQPSALPCHRSAVFNDCGPLAKVSLTLVLLGQDLHWQLWVTCDDSCILSSKWYSTPVRTLDISERRALCNAQVCVAWIIYHKLILDVMNFWMYCAWWVVFG